MSPLLFNMHVQDLIECLCGKGLGCHMGNHFSRCFNYADNITLVAPSANDLNAMFFKIIYLIQQNYIQDSRNERH